MNTPNDVTDDELDALERGVWPRVNPETIFHVTIFHDRRAFELHYEYTSYAPEAERWTCVDLNTYDGAPDTEGCGRFIGYGKTSHEARTDLLEQFKEYDAPKRGRWAGLGHPEQPPEFVAEKHEDYDDEC